jgi:hypothetical protein
VKPNLARCSTRGAGKDAATGAHAHHDLGAGRNDGRTLGIPDNNKMGGAWIMGAGTLGAHNHDAGRVLEV